MLDVLLNAFQLDAFLIAMAGQFVNEGSAKLTLTAVKALGLAIVGSALGAPLEATEKPSPKVVRRRKKKPPRAVAKSRKSAARKRRPAGPARARKA